MAKSDLALYLEKVQLQRASQISFRDGDNQEANGTDDQNKEEINEEIIKEMCNFSQLSSTKGAKLQGGFNAMYRSA